MTSLSCTVTLQSFSTASARLAAVELQWAEPLLSTLFRGSRNRRYSLPLTCFVRTLRQCHLRKAGSALKRLWQLLEVTVMEAPKRLHLRASPFRKLRLPLTLLIRFHLGLNPDSQLLTFSSP